MKGETLLLRLQKEHRNIRKAYKVRDQDEVDVVARLIVSYQLLTDRIATEAILYATSPPEPSLSKDELRDKQAKVKEINEMLNMTNKIRTLSKDILSDATSSFAASADSRSDEKASLITDAKKQLDELGFSLDAIDKKKESVECRVIDHDNDKAA